MFVGRSKFNIPKRKLHIHCVCVRACVCVYIYIYIYIHTYTRIMHYGSSSSLDPRNSKYDILTSKTPKEMEYESKVKC